jgi:hypothetical protein
MITRLVSYPQYFNTPLHYHATETKNQIWFV